MRYGHEVKISFNSEPIEILKEDRSARSWSARRELTLTSSGSLALKKVYRYAMHTNNKVYYKLLSFRNS